MRMKLNGGRNGPTQSNRVLSEDAAAPPDKSSTKTLSPPHTTNPTMRFLLPSLLVLGASVVSAASSWNFEDATIAVNSKTAFKDKYAPQLLLITVLTPMAPGSPAKLQLASSSH